MEFPDVMDTLANSGQVRRPDWPEGTYIESPEGRVSPGGIVLVSPEGTKHFMDLPSYSKDILADDWEAVV